MTIEMFAVAKEINYRAKHNGLDKCIWYIHSIDKDIKLNYIEISKAIGILNCVLLGRKYLKHIIWAICNTINWFYLHVLWRKFTVFTEIICGWGGIGVFILYFMHIQHHIKNKSVLLYIEFYKIKEML